MDIKTHWEKVYKTKAPDTVSWYLPHLETSLSLKERGIELRNFFEQTTDVPSVFGWVPAASIYFNEPDGHLLEFIASFRAKRNLRLGLCPWVSGTD